MPVNKNIDKRNKDIKIYINGSFYKREDAKISVFDSGFLLGDGIWEGIRLVNNTWMFLDAHLDRLFEGCKAIDLDINLSKDVTENIILWDERLSSQGAFNLSSDLTSNTNQKVKKLDENSAQFILQGVLDYLSKKNT